MWSKGGEEVESSRIESEVFPVWAERTQEVGVSKNERKKETGDGTATRSVEESERAQ